MDAAIVTVGDELLAGEIENTNGTWLARELTGRGVSVRRISTIPDESDLVAQHVSECSDAYDAVIVTGGVGSTPDDVTMVGVADAFGVSLAVNDEALADVEATLERINARREEGTLELDLEAEAALPEGAEPLLNEEGISPGCVISNVFVTPGIPREMKPMFESVADRFDGSVYSQTVYTGEAESHIVDHLEEATEEFDVSVGCYPDPDRGPKRIKITDDDADRVDSAYDFLTRRLDTVDAP